MAMFPMIQMTFRSWWSACPILTMTMSRHQWLHASWRGGARGAISCSWRACSRSWMLGTPSHHPRRARRQPGEQIISFHDVIEGRVAPARAPAFHHRVATPRCSQAAPDTAGQAATSRGVELLGRARDVPAADRARGRVWRHVVGSGRLGAETSRTLHAAHEHVRLWARLWRGVERGHSNRKTHEIRS